MADKDLKKTLAPLRKKIDDVDNQIVELLEQRARLTTEVGQKKRAGKAQNFSIYEREISIIRRLRKKSAMLAPHIEPIYRQIISACISFERPTKITFLGPTATFSHEMAVRTFGDAATYIAASTISEAVQQVEKKNADYALIPFENSSTGTVGESLDRLLTTSLSISGESQLRVRHNLLVAESDADASLSDIVEIHAHPQPLEQCRQWLQKHVPQAHLIPATSTAAAVEALKHKRKKTAAIGSDMAMRHYPVRAVAEGIEDYSNNHTRFLVLGHRTGQPTGQDKTSIVVASFHEAGSMHRLLAPLTEHGVNMTKLESRPAPGTLWEYVFYIDVEGHQEDAPLKQALAEIKKQSRFFKILGSYPQSLD